MSLVLGHRSNPYAGSPLDRAVPRRTDAAWLAGHLAAPDSLFVPVWRSKNLIRDAAPDGPTEAVFLATSEGARFCAPEGEGPYPSAFLGLLRGRALFAFDVSEADAPESLIAVAGASFVDLRSVPGLLSPDDAAVLAHARGLMHWRRGARFCGKCGRACRPTRGGNVMLCPACDVEHFPRTDPAVIMLVSDGSRALLAHSQRFARQAMYSTLAGFVEPGESLEEAVAREVAEETGVAIANVRYHSSQPWPFPGSIMLGFMADATSATITLDRSELSDARWFTRAEVATPESVGITLPRVDSIARRLIEDWLAPA